MDFHKYAASNNALHPEAQTRVCGIKNNTYASNIPLILKMTEMAIQDFPDLRPEDIHVVSYSGDRWKGQTGIEFSIKIDRELPSDYRLGGLEYIFAGN